MSVLLQIYPKLKFKGKQQKKLQNDCSQTARQPVVLTILNGVRAFGLRAIGQVVDYLSFILTHFFFFLNQGSASEVALFQR